MPGSNEFGDPTYRFDETPELRANAKVKAWVESKVRQCCYVDMPKHFLECPDLVVTPTEAYDGMYGCETGCEALRVTADVSCPHEPEVYEWTYNDGLCETLMEWIEEIDVALEDLGKEGWKR
jgi:hypothetical protein